MQGDPKVDTLMRPVRAAIERHVVNRDAVTDIYNRAYEAVMQCMDAKDGKTYCAYCGAEYPLDDNAATLVSEHIKTCAKHPMRAIESEITQLTTALAAANEDAERLDVEVVAFLGRMEPGKHYDQVAAKHEAHRARVGGAKIGGL